MDPATGSAPRVPVDERLVARLWDDQHPFSLPLKTVLGDEVRVVYRGRRRYDRGPDFPGALIALPGEALALGDVEVHVNSSDWRRHRHHRDPYYNGVVLHVVLHHDDPEPCLRQDGFQVPVVALAVQLSRPLESILLQDGSDAPRPIPCWRGGLEIAGELCCLLEQKGMERFEVKASSYESGLTLLPPDQLLYQGVAGALGYSQNRQPFEKLAELLPLESALAHQSAMRGRGGAETWGVGEERNRMDRMGRMQSPDGGPASVPPPIPRPLSPGYRPLAPDPQGIEALLMGAAGLLPSQRGVSFEGDAYTWALEERWAAEGASWAGASMQPAEWQFFRVRPNNFPTRRLAALAHVVSRWPAGGLSTVLANLALSLEPRKLSRAMEALLLGAPHGGYWAGHCDFGLELRRPADLVGRQRAAEIAINVFLPFLAARAALRSERDLGQRVREAYRLYPKRGDNELTRYVAVQVTGVPRPSVARSACRQQGLLHIYRTWCEVKRCGDCPCGGGETG